MRSKFDDHTRFWLSLHRCWSARSNRRSVFTTFEYSGEHNSTTYIHTFISTRFTRCIESHWIFWKTIQVHQGPQSCEYHKMTNRFVYLHLAVIRNFILIECFWIFRSQFVIWFIIFSDCARPAQWRHTDCLPAAKHSIYITICIDT